MRFEVDLDLSVRRTVYVEASDENDAIIKAMLEGKNLVGAYDVDVEGISEVSDE